MSAANLRAGAYPQRALSQPSGAEGDCPLETRVTVDLDKLPQQGCPTLTKCHTGRLAAVVAGAGVRVVGRGGGGGSCGGGPRDLPRQAAQPLHHRVPVCCSWALGRHRKRHERATLHDDLSAARRVATGGSVRQGTGAAARGGGRHGPKPLPLADREPPPLALCWPRSAVSGERSRTEQPGRTEPGGHTCWCSE